MKSISKSKDSGDIYTELLIRMALLFMSFQKDYTKTMDIPESLWQTMLQQLNVLWDSLNEMDFIKTLSTAQINILRTASNKDQRVVKRGNRKYQSIRTASSTIKGIEVIHALHKGSRTESSFFWLKRNFNLCFF